MNSDSFAMSRPNVDKPLEELSHDDIMQLTREDCRRYLKQKGMRRPSWNKSQAIQQVLSLKNLFSSSASAEEPEKAASASVTMDVDLNECAPDSLLFESNTVSSDTETSENVDIESFQWSSEKEMPVLASEQDIILSTQTMNGSAQLTIFYSGKVIVYDDVAPETMRAIMLFAGEENGSSSNFRSAEPDRPRSSASNMASTMHASRRPENMLGQQHERKSSSSFSYGPGSSVRSQIQGEPRCSRKASLQRFLEKRKDRSRSKVASAESKKPLLMGMFMHPSFVQRHYWSEVANKKKCHKSPSPITCSNTLQQGSSELEQD